MVREARISWDTNIERPIELDHRGWDDEHEDMDLWENPDQAMDKRSKAARQSGERRRG